MSYNSDAKLATADVLTLLLHNQYSLAAGLEELALWIKANGGIEAHGNAVAALEALDVNASAITAGILKLRQ